MGQLLFGLSPGFFDGARILHAGQEPEAAAEARPVEEAKEVIELEDETRLSRWTCRSCELKFQTGEEQRAHFKSDFHRLNVKRKLAGKACFSEEEFEKIADGNLDCDVSSVSGSDSEMEEEDEEWKQLQLVVKSKQIPIQLSSGAVAQVWRCLLLNGSEKEDVGVGEEELLSRLRKLVESPKLVWVVVLAAGGHFAGVVVDIKTGVVQAHQTYHRYVVRAKAGGRQSTRDGTGRAPKSAGASLRRYNEMALNKEIKSLFESWAGHLREASSIFVSAPSGNRQSVFGETPLLDRSDPRVRQIPFTTKRPTYKEARRVYSQLSALSFRDDSSDASDVKASEKPAIPGESKKKKKSRGNKEGEAAAAAAAEPEAEQPAPALHQAVLAGDVSAVVQLLEEGADPCVKYHGRTAYTCSSDKNMRNAFRKFMAAHPDLWDWNAAGVPSGLTDEMEAAQIAKQADKNAKRRAKERERKKEKKEQDKAAKASKAAAALVTPQQVEANEMAKQRELRAAAAEARVKGSLLLPVSGSSIELCSCCSAPLANKVPFYKFSYKYCSVACVNSHKRDE